MTISLLPADNVAKARSGNPGEHMEDEVPVERGRRRFSVTLSPKSTEAFEWLKEVTDADTDSEVIRNALRVHYVLLRGHIEGDVFFVRDASGEMTKIDLFVAR